MAFQLAIHQLSVLKPSVTKDLVMVNFFTVFYSFSKEKKKGKENLAFIKVKLSSYKCHHAKLTNGPLFHEIAN